MVFLRSPFHSLLVLNRLKCKRGIRKFLRVLKPHIFDILAHFRCLVWWCSSNSKIRTFYIPEGIKFESGHWRLQLQDLQDDNDQRITIQYDLSIQKWIVASSGMSGSTTVVPTMVFHVEGPFRTLPPIEFLWRFNGTKYKLLILTRSPSTTWLWIIALIKLELFMLGSVFYTQIMLNYNIMIRVVHGLSR